MESMRESRSFSPLMVTLVVASALFAAGLAPAAVRESPSYKISFDALTAGGGAATSSSYRQPQSAIGQEMNFGFASSSSYRELSGAVFVFPAIDNEMDLEVNKSVDKPLCLVSDTVTFTIVVQNSGPSSAETVDMLDTLTAGFLYVPGTLTATGGTATYDAGTIHWSRASVAASEQFTIEFKAIVTSPGSNLNTATVSAAIGTDTNLTNNSSTAHVNAIQRTWTMLKDDTFDTTTTWEYSGDGRRGPGGMEHDYDLASQALRVRVYSANYDTTTGAAKRTRIGGWYTTQQPDWLPYSAIGSMNYVRAKFYVYATGQGIPTQRNQIPVVQFRVSNRFAMTSNLEITPHNNTLTEPGLQDLLGELAPTTDSLHPSVYRVDYDPPEVQYLIDNSATEGIWRSFSAFCTDAQDNGFICLTESSIGIYPALALENTTAALRKVYTASDGDLARFAGYSSRFNVQFAPDTPEGGLPSIVDMTGASGARIDIVANSSGVTFDTLAMNPDWVGVAQHYLHETRGGVLPLSSVPRVQPGKLYKMRFHVTGQQVTNMQCPIWLYAHTLAFGYGVKLEMGGAYCVNSPTDPTNIMAWAIMPGINTQVTNGWYDLLMNTPMDPEIRAEFTGGESLSQRMPLISAEPGPGANLDSKCNLGTGIFVLDTLNAAVPNAYANEAGNFTVDQVEVYEFDQVPDSGT